MGGFTPPRTVCEARPTRARLAQLFPENGVTGVVFDKKSVMGRLWESLSGCGGCRGGGMADEASKRVFVFHHYG